jgi:hypothetical protein
VAQATADEARRVNAQTTAEAEARVQEQLRWTAEADARVHEQAVWTATAAPLSVPATATQQAILNLQIAAQQTLEAGKLTATAEAPTLTVAMADAKSYSETATMRAGAEVFALFSSGLAMLGVAVFVLRRWNSVPAPSIQPAPASEVTRIEMREKGKGFAHYQRFSVPCSEEALTELAEGLLSGTKTLAVNQWEGRESEHFTRERFGEMRAWMLANKFALSIGSGILALTEAGQSFLEAWLEKRSLTEGFSFAGDDAVPGNIMKQQEA